MYYYYKNYLDDDDINSDNISIDSGDKDDDKDKDDEEKDDDKEEKDNDKDNNSDTSSDKRGIENKLTFMIYAK